MSAHSLSSRHSSQGFSLIEIMVGMVIGLLGIIVIMQVFSVFEGQKRSTTSGDDAQNDGIISLYGMQKDIAQAGYGINSRKLYGCPLITPIISLPALAPIIINPKKGTAAAPITGANPLINAIPADANTDSLLVIYGNSNNVPEGTLISGVDSINSNYTVEGGAAASGVAGSGGKGFQNGDLVFIDSGNRTSGCNTNPITLVSYPLYLTTVNNTNALNVPVAQVPASFAYDAVKAKVDYPTLYNMGPSPRMLAYAVINGTLGVCNYGGPAALNCAIAANYTQIASDIVSMRAECSAPAGIRLVLVARSNQRDPNIITSATGASPNAPTWGGATPIVTAAGALGADAAPNNWGHYRYKTFETIIPVRNAIWAGAKGC